MILCCGDALVDLIPDRTGGSVPHVGGAVFNTALALGRLGVPVALLTGLSTDGHGRALRQALAGSGVSLDYAVRTSRPTTRAIVTLKEGAAEYRFENEGSALGMLTLADLKPPQRDVTTLFFGGGISLCALPVAESLVAYAGRHGKGRLVMADPNVRPSFVHDEPAYRDRLDRLLSVCHVVKVSVEDLAWLLPDGPMSEKVAALRRKGPDTILLTDGERGATVHRGDRSLHVPARRARVVDTIGAGDTFNAGFLAGLLHEGLMTPAGLASAPDDGLQRCVALGAAAAAVTVSRKGANPPWRSTLPGV